MRLVGAERACQPPLVVVLVELVAADGDDVEQIGRSRRAEGDPGKRDQFAARLGKAMAQRHALALGDHLFEAADILGRHRMRAP